MNTINTAADFQKVVFAAIKAKATTANSKTSYSENDPNPDLVVCYDKPTSPHFLRLSTCEMLLQMGFNAQQFATALCSVPQKQVKRATQFLNGIEAKDLDAVDLTTVGILAVAVRYQGKIPTHSLAYYALTGKGDENTSDLTKGVGFSKLHAYIETRATTGKRASAKMGMGTATTQTSRSIGKNGFLLLLDVVNDAGELNTANPLTARFIETAERALAKIWG